MRTPAARTPTNTPGASSVCCTISITSAGRRWRITPTAVRRFSRAGAIRSGSAAPSCPTPITRGCPGKPPEKVLFACDELCGFLTACALVTPSKSLHDVKVKSVRKKMKSKAFAASVNRDDIVNGAAALGVDLNEHIEFVLEAMRGIADELGLAGSRPD